MSKRVSKRTWCARKLQSFFLTEDEELGFVKSHYGEDSSQMRALEFIHSHAVQVSLGVLLMIDVIAVIVELVLDAHFPYCQAILNNAACAVDAARRLAAANDGSSGCTVECLHHPHAVEVAHRALFGISIGILAVFVLELLTLFAILRLSFFRHFVYVLDFIIVTTAMVLEISLHNADDAAALSLIVIARIWRFFRIGHGIFSDTYEFSKHRNEELKERIVTLERQVAELENPARFHDASKGSIHYTT